MSFTSFEHNVKNHVVRTGDYGAVAVAGCCPGAVQPTRRCPRDGDWADASI